MSAPSANPEDEQTVHPQPLIPANPTLKDVIRIMHQGFSHLNTILHSMNTRMDAMDSKINSIDNTVQTGFATCNTNFINTNTNITLIANQLNNLQNQFNTFNSCQCGNTSQSNGTTTYVYNGNTTNNGHASNGTDSGSTRNGTNLNNNNNNMNDGNDVMMEDSSGQNMNGTKVIQCGYTETDTMNNTGNKVNDDKENNDIENKDDK